MNGQDWLLETFETWWEWNAEELAQFYRFTDFPGRLEELLVFVR